VKALRTYPFELSGGLRQRAMIAMALVCRPALLIADEPTTALDVTIQAQILKLLKDLQADLGMAILLITHDLGVVANMADEVVVMYRGRVMEAGTREDIFRKPEHPYLKALLAAVPRFDMKPGEKLIPLREIKSDLGEMVRRKDKNGLAAKALDAADRATPILSVRHLRKSYAIRNSGMFGGGQAQSVLAVDDVSFDVFRGECLGLVGESGCGKTTVSKMIMRALTPDSGDILFEGRDARKFDGAELFDYRRKVQFVFRVGTAVDPRDRRRTLAPFDRARVDARGRARRSRAQPLSAFLLRRAAPAHRHRARLGLGAGTHVAGRARFGARRVDPGAGLEPAAGSQEGARPHLHLRQP
jgi:peptide/nickel transport system ATP-binding protein